MCAAALNSNCYSDFACQFALSKYAIPSFRTSISSSQPTTDGRFEYDFATKMTWNVIPMAGNVQFSNLLMNVFKCGTMRLCSDTSSDLAFPGSHASLILEYPREASASLEGQMTIIFDGATYFFQDSDETGGLKTFLEDTVLLDRGAHVDIKWSAEGATTVQFQDLYSLTVLLFFQEENRRPEDIAVESAWRFVFSSTESDIYASFKWWIDRLATNENPVATST